MRNILEGNVEHKLQQTDQLEIVVHGPGKELKSRHASVVRIHLEQLKIP